MFFLFRRFLTLTSALAALLLLSTACISTVSPTKSAAKSAAELEQTIEAAVSATIAAIPSPTPLPTPTPAPTATARPQPTATLMPTLAPTPTPTAVPELIPPPLEVTFQRIFAESDELPQFQVQVRNTTDMPIVEYRMEICPKGLSGQDVIDPQSGSYCFVVSAESIFQPANARPPTGYSEVNDGLYERIVDGEVLQWAIVRYPSWVGTGFEAARRAEVVLTFARFANGDTWEDGQLFRP